MSWWEIFMLHPCLEDTWNWGPWGAFCSSTGHAHRVVRRGSMRRKWGVLKNARKRWRILIKVTAKPIIKICVSHNLGSFRALMLLQTHCLEHICIIMQLKWSTAKRRYSKDQTAVGKLNTICHEMNPLSPQDTSRCIVWLPATYWEYPSGQCIQTHPLSNQTAKTQSNWKFQIKNLRYMNEKEEKTCWSQSAQLACLLKSPLPQLPVAGSEIHCQNSKDTTVISR